MVWLSVCELVKRRTTKNLEMPYRPCPYLKTEQKTWQTGKAEGTGLYHHNCII